MAVQLTSPRNRCCSTSRPGAAPLVVAAQRGERHAAGRPAAARQLAAQPPARATVVGDGHDGGQVVGVTRRSADRDADSPCPPPRATAEETDRGVIRAQVPVARPGVHDPRRAAGSPSSSAIGDTAVLAARTADREVR